METKIKLTAEGKVGSGKSTLLKILEEFMLENGIEVSKGPAEEHTLWVYLTTENVEEFNG